MHHRLKRSKKDSEEAEEPLVTLEADSEALSVADLIALDNEAGEVTVSGYIVGYVISPQNVS